MMVLPSAYSGGCPTWDHFIVRPVAPRRRAGPGGVWGEVFLPLYLLQVVHGIVAFLSLPCMLTIGTFLNFRISMSLKKLRHASSHGKLWDRNGWN